MQHHIIAFPSATMLWIPRDHCQYLTLIHLGKPWGLYVPTWEKLNIITISAPEFRIWQHLENHWNGTLLHHLVNIPSAPSDKLYKQMANSNRPINSFISTDESIGQTVSIWTIFSHSWVYVMAIGSLIPAGLGIFSCYFFWCWPVRLVC